MDKQLSKLPNILTWSRIFIIPVVVVCMMAGNPVGDPLSHTWNVFDLSAGLLLTFAGLTDFFDGWLARRYAVESLMGRLLDPLADKLLVVSALIILVEQHKLAGWMGVVLIVRDLGINSIRIAALEKNIFIHSGLLGKAKTVFLDVAIVALTIYSPLHTPLGTLPSLTIGTVAIWLAFVSSMTSAVHYLLSYKKSLSNSHANPTPVKPKALFS